MGKRGPAGKSPSEQRLDGNPGKKRLPVEMFTPEGAPFVPEHLSEDATTCAEHILRHMKTKRLTSVDSYALAAFATAWSWHKASTHMMNSPDFTPICEGSTGQPIVNPWFKIQNDASAQMLKWAAKLYLTPADRHTLPDGGQEKPRSKFDGLIGPSESSGLLNS